MSLKNVAEYDFEMGDEDKKRLLAMVQAQLLAEMNDHDNAQSTTLDSPNHLSKDCIDQIALKVIRQEMPETTFYEARELSRYMLDSICGLGVIEPLLRDEEITDIMIEGTDVYIVKDGEKRRAQNSFSTLDDIKCLIDRITNRVAKRIDISRPICDCDLHDGSRCHIIIPPISDRIYVTIRKLGCMDLRLDNWVGSGALSNSQAKFLDDAVSARKNILISGGTGAGKTTLLNTLAKGIDESHIVATLEDTYELKLPHPRVRSLLTRDESVEGGGHIDFRTLIKNVLRMNPDRLIMGEVRDESAYDLLHALNIGHRGSFSTIHANSVLDALWRLETLALAGAPTLSLMAIKRQIARVVDVIVQLQGVEIVNGRSDQRRVIEIASLQSQLSDDELYQLDLYHTESGS